MNIPERIEREIQEFAQTEHITHDEALLVLIQTGLSAIGPARRSVFEQGLGLFGNPADSALLDEVVSMAYEERKRPAKSVPVP